MSRPIPPPCDTRHLLICTNQRDPATGKPSCGMNGSVRLREQLKIAIKKGGLKGRVKATATGCLDYCPSEGCVVGFYPENTWEIVSTDEASGEALFAKLTEGVVQGQSTPGKPVALP